MCGIFGFAIHNTATLPTEAIKKMTRLLFHFSTTRGQEASGLALRAGNTIRVHKKHLPGKKFIRSRAVQDILQEYITAEQESPLCLTGHTRMATNGLRGVNENNMPLIAGQTVGVLNGIITNEKALWETLPEKTRQTDNDAEVVIAKINALLEQKQSFPQALAAVLHDITGAANIALLHEAVPVLLLGTNTGSLYTLTKAEGIFVFASEAFILKQLASKIPALAQGHIAQIRPGDAFLMNLENQTGTHFSWRKTPVQTEILVPKKSCTIYDTDQEEARRRKNLKRCTRCILPETMPYIAFDDKGVCNFCKEHTPAALADISLLRETIKKTKTAPNKADCVVAFSGGRDSCYTLHYLVKELGIQPVAYTYDWGMVTDLARRNQARMTGQLGLEHIIISADITKKRRYIRNNLKAWIKKPVPGMVPLLMAGDKHFFYYANILKKQLGIEHFIWSENQMERTTFKTGFCSIKKANSKHRIYKMSHINKLRLIHFYGKQYLLNPAYINSSLLDTFFAFCSYYLIPHDYLWFFDYLQWDEKTIDTVLLSEYDWETSPDTTTTWRIGDGTAPFYNYIYWKIAGLTENDTLRSNQIRAGHLNREEALQKVTEENLPRYDSITEYLNMVHLDPSEVFAAIDAMPRLF